VEAKITTKCDICGRPLGIRYKKHVMDDGKIVCYECVEKLGPEKEITNICSNCHEKIGVGKGKFPLESNKTGKHFLFCARCYDALSKEDKLQLEPMKNVEGTGFLGVLAIGGIFGYLGYSVSENDSIMNPIKQFNLTLKEINTYSIMNYNRHFLFSNDSLKSGIMTSLGKQLKKEKLNELSKQHFLKDFDLLEGKEQKDVKKMLKLFLKENMKKNKKLDTLEKFLAKEGF